MHASHCTLRMHTPKYAQAQGCNCTALTGIHWCIHTQPQGCNCALEDVTVLQQLLSSLVESGQLVVPHTHSAGGWLGFFNCNCAPCAGCLVCLPALCVLAPGSLVPALQWGAPM